MLAERPASRLARVASGAAVGRGCRAWRADTGQEQAGPPPAYRVPGASPGAPRAHRLDRFVRGRPAISRARVAYVAAAASAGGFVGALGSGTLVVVDLAPAPRPIIGFTEPLRSVHALDLRGSELAWFETEPPRPGPTARSQRPQFTARQVVFVDVDRAAPFAPAPASPPTEDPATPIARCGPVPP